MLSLSSTNASHHHWTSSSPTHLSINTTYRLLRQWTHPHPLLPVLYWLSWHCFLRWTTSDCLEVKREYYQNCSVLDCMTQCSLSAAHLYEQFLQVQQIGFVTYRYAVRRGSCLDLYYCNMMEWFWWDSSLISTANWFHSVLWHCWFDHLTCKNCY